MFRLLPLEEAKTATLDQSKERV